MDKQKPVLHDPGLEPGRFYRCRPTMSEANIIGPYLVDLEGLNLQFFHLKDFSLYKRVPLLNKQDQYCAQLAVLSPQILIIFGIDKFVLFNIERMQISETVKVNNYIEKLEVRHSFVTILTSDQDSEHKLINCWKVDPKTGAVEQKYKSTEFVPVEYEECTDDNMCMNLILSIEGHPKVYVYWRDTTYMIEVDPRNQLSHIYNRHNSISLVYDLNKETYAEIVDKAIHVNNKTTGKRVAQLMNQGEVFTQLYTDGSSDKIFTISNLGLKKWKLEANSPSVLYASSNKNQVKKVFVGENQSMIGLNLQSNTVVVWKNPEEYSSYSFPNQVIRRIIKLNEHQAFFLLQATASSQEQNQYQVSKYNKLQIYDFKADNQIAKKAMIKSQHSVDGDSIVINQQSTIRFIVNEKGEEDETEKKYIIRWTPFEKDENGKDTKRKQIKGVQALEIVRLYPFNKILGLNLVKSKVYSLFQKQEDKTQVVVFDYNVKKIGDYDLQGEITNVELSENNSIYTIGPKRVCIYSIATEHKNRLEKVNELDISAVSVYPIMDCLLVKKDNSFLLLDSQFECIMREQVEQDDKNYKVIPVSASKFLLKTQRKLEQWDIEAQNVEKVQVPDCEPNLLEFMDSRLVVADKWVQVYDFKLA